MKKRFLSVIVLSAALFSVQAQEGKGGISPEMLGQIKQSYQGTAADKALRNAIGNNDIRKLALNQENMQGMDTHFSIKVESKGITDQKSSGRCWLFTGLNVMRAKTLAEYGFQSFEFSEVYPFFWDQLEKANLFLQGIIDTSKSPLTDKTVEWLFQHPLSDGGTFTSGTSESPALLYAAIATSVTVSDKIYGASCLFDANTPTRHNPIRDIAVPT